MHLIDCGSGQSFAILQVLRPCHFLTLLPQIWVRRGYAWLRAGNA
jgi:hypothetical protein